MVLARAIDITSAGAPTSIQERKLREKSERRNEMREKRSDGGFLQERKLREKSEMMVASSNKLLLERRGFCDLTAHWALLRRFDRGSLPSLYYGVI